MDIRKVVSENPILAIMRNVPLEKTIPYAQAIVAGGIRFFEVAMNSADACEQIRLLTDHFPQDVYIGAGTAITVDRVKAAVDAGAKFILTPSTDKDVVLYCENKKIPLLPGVMTPTDVSFCVQHGFNTLKLFPAGSLPDGYIKSLKGPFDDTEYVAIGGVSMNNIEDFFAKGFMGVGLGSGILPADYVENDKWAEASAYVRALIYRVRLAGKLG